MVESRVDAGDLDRQTLWIHVEFLSEDHRQSGIDALAHLAFADDHGDAIVCPNAHKSVRLEFLGRAVTTPDEVGAQQLPGGDSTGNHANTNEEMPASGTRSSVVVACSGRAHAG